MAAAAGAGAAAGQARALSDEVDAVLADADRKRARPPRAAARPALGGRGRRARRSRPDGADVVPDLEERRSRARAEVVRAGERYAAALAGPERPAGGGRCGPCSPTAATTKAPGEALEQLTVVRCLTHPRG